MSGLITRCIFLLCLSTVLFSSVYADEWPVIDSPPESNVTWVGDDINQNGLPMQVKSFSSDLPVNEIIEFYRAEWDDGSKLKPVENTLAQWKIIGMQEGDHYLTVQAKVGTTRASEGFLSVSTLPVAVPPNVEVDFPMLTGSTVVSLTGSNDISRSGMTLVLKNDFSLQSNMSFYEAEMPVAGWDITRKDTQPVNGGISKFLYLQRRKQACILVLSTDELGNTVVVANTVKY